MVRIAIAIAFFATTIAIAAVDAALPTVISTDGSCGTTSKAVVVCPSGNCCSQYGWCGTTSAYCGKGCQPAFGICAGTPSSKTSSTTKTTTTSSRTTVVTTSTTRSSTTKVSPSASASSTTFTAKSTGTTPLFSTSINSSSRSPTTSTTTSASRTTTTAAPTIISTNGQCGSISGKAVACPTGQCCSKYGYCGTTSEYCGSGCQSAFGSCSPSGNARCGPHEGGASCPSSQCCSIHGWCGSSAEHCGLGCREGFGKGCTSVTIPSPPIPKSGSVCHITSARNVPAVSGAGSDRAPQIIYECKKPGVFALTYDDGLLTNYDAYLLDVLKVYGIKGSWFINGVNFGDITTAETQALVKRVYSEGHDLLSHTYTHPHMPSLSFAQQKAELQKLEDAIFSLVNVRPQIFRPPYGEYNADTLRAAKDLAYVASVIWNIDTNDYNTLSVSDSLAQVKNGLNVCVNNGTPGLGAPIALEHSFPVSTVNYTLQLIPMLYSAGYKVVTISECIGENPYKP
ncbi:hypothetical protein BJ742DRAFT_843320 [Cladochytrium replicatum]|nr:hypothetical protein BJ742DRAFT_843320 [Cladochytrium replicatum]